MTSSDEERGSRFKNSRNLVASSSPSDDSPFSDPAVSLLRAISKRDFKGAFQ